MLNKKFKTNDIVIFWGVFKIELCNLCFFFVSYCLIIQFQRNSQKCITEREQVNHDIIEIRERSKRKRKEREQENKTMLETKLTMTLLK
jgi:hypothetical protein